MNESGSIESLSLWDLCVTVTVTVWLLGTVTCKKEINVP